MVRERTERERGEEAGEGERGREGRGRGYKGGEGTEGERGEMERGGRERIKVGTDLQQLYKHSNQGGHIMYCCHLHRTVFVLLHSAMSSNYELVKYCFP